mgnify:CR=1 FL=1|tara:strand:+ start:494 stop:1030 length:537 start_codon:yes stop_codon:yes gene_type:complete
MAIGFGKQARYERAATPQFAAAAAAEGRQAQQAKAQANALRSQTMLGAGSLYNAGMGDRTPIADMLFDESTAPSGMVDGAMAGDEASRMSVNELATPFDTMGGAGDMGGGAVATPFIEEGAQQVTELGANAALEAGTGAALEAGTTAAAGAGGFGGALAAANPYISAALLADRLGIFG